ncbi:hypothetical protein L218DRAFT_724232 [Marasmius fiardii PR-910]|nr:hypothetical protein L218DRAFT_724232 [Marasmius fiardii PR-910]
MEGIRVNKLIITTPRSVSSGQCHSTTSSCFDDKTHAPVLIVQSFDSSSSSGSLWDGSSTRYSVTHFRGVVYRFVIPHD